MLTSLFIIGLRISVKAVQVIQRACRGDAKNRENLGECLD